MNSAPTCKPEADMSIRSHPMRASLSEEMHVRRFPYLSAPSRVLQVVALLGEQGGEESRAHLARLCAPRGLTVPANARYFAGKVGQLDFVWERHTEASSYTFIHRGDAVSTAGEDPFDAVARSWLKDLPGQVIRATRVALLASDMAGNACDLVKEWFGNNELIICDVAEGRARIWSDFRLHEDGFGRLLIADMGLEGREASQLVQRLQELGNYRNMALLGLPLAHKLAPEVSSLEQRLVTLTGAVSERRSEDSMLLEELGYLSAELARLVAETRYRMSASRAYAQLTLDRLQSLKVGEVRGHSTLADFTERRLIPAMRTCESFTQRLEDLSQRVARASALLSTRVNTALAIQNRDLLNSMDRRTQLQLQLQKTVEGLSVVAISYYAIGLVGYMLKAAHELYPELKPELSTGLAVPIVAGIAALLLRRIHRRLP